MLKHWLASGWRSLIAHPLFSAITIVSLSIGSCGAILAGSHIQQHLSYERLHADADRIVIVARKQSAATMAADRPGGGSRAEGAAVTRPSTGVSLPLKPAISGTIPGLEAQTRLIYATTPLEQGEVARITASPSALGEPNKPVFDTVYVDEDFFKVFNLEFVEGSGAGLQEMDAIILTQSRARALFGDKPAVGQSVQGIKGHALQVIGVVRDLPATTHLRFQTMAGLRTFTLPAGTQMGDQGNWRRTLVGYHYLKRKPGVDAAVFASSARHAIESAVQAAAAAQPAQAPSPQQGRLPAVQTHEWSIVPLLASHLAGPLVIDFPTDAAGASDMTIIWTLAIAALALMAISGFNYVTLSLARNLQRQREVAVRKVLGASKGDIVRHYLVESALMTGIAVAIGFIAADFLHPWFARAIGQPETLFGLHDPTFLAIALGAFVVLVLTVGAYPALYLGSVRPQSGLGEGVAPLPGKLGQFVSVGLLAVQIAMAAGLVIVSSTMAAQANYIANRDMGFTVRDRYRVAPQCPVLPDIMAADARDQAKLLAYIEQMNSTVRRCRTMIRDVLEHIPGIGKPFFVSGQITVDTLRTVAVSRADGGEEIGQASSILVDTEALQSLGTTLLAGRYFNSKSAYDRALIDYQSVPRPTVRISDPSAWPEGMPKRLPAIVTRAMLPSLGAATPQQALGQQIVVGTRRETFEIVGVIENWHQRALKYEVSPVVFIPQEIVQTALIEIPRDRFDAARAAIENEWRRRMGDPSLTVAFTDLEAELARAYRADFQLMWALIGFAGVAIGVAGLGVYGLSAFEMRRRVREIGIRKALGATPANVVGRVIVRALAFAAIASVVAWPIGYWLSQQWLSGFVYRTSLAPAVLPVATCAILAFVALAVGLNAIRAGAIRPASALRSA